MADVKRCGALVGPEGDRCNIASPCREHEPTQTLAARALKAEAEVERLRTVLRSLISCGSTSPLIRATAMNTLEPGSGDAWLHKGDPR